MGIPGRRADPELIDRYKRLRLSGTSKADARRETGLSWDTCLRHDPPGLGDPIRSASKPLAHKTPEELVAILDASRGSSGITDIESIVEAAVRRALGAAGISAPGPPEPPRPTQPEAHDRVVLWPDVPSTLVWISDLHVPYHDRPAVDAAMSLIEDIDPEVVVLGGDVFDCYGPSDYDKDPERESRLQDEFDAFIPLRQRLSERPGKKVFLEGNHEDRIRRLVAKNPSLLRMRSIDLRVAAEIPDTWAMYPPRTLVRIGDMTYLHGDLKGAGSGGKYPAAGLLSKLKTSFVCGHFHREQVFVEPGYDHVPRVGVTSGHLSDTRASADFMTIPSWTKGIVVVEYDSSGAFSALPLVAEGGRIIWRKTTYPLRRR